MLPHFAGELLVEHGELATVRALAAEVALRQGDLGAARDYWSAQLAEDATRVAPQLALARIAVLAGDLDEARSRLDRATGDLSILTAAQVASAAALAELLGQPSRAQSLRVRYARLEVKSRGGARRGNRCRSGPIARNERQREHWRSARCHLGA